MARALCGAQALREQRLEQAALPARCEFAQAGQRLVADAAFRARDGAQEGRVIVVVDHQPQPRAQVADLGTVKEALSARDPIRNARFAQRLLEHPGLVIGPVEHRKVIELNLAALAAALTQDGLDARDGAFGLVFFAVGFDQCDRFAVAQIAPESFLEQFGVVRDHRIGRTQDAAGGSVILFQRDDLQCRVVDTELFQVLTVAPRQP